MKFMNMLFQVLNCAILLTCLKVSQANFITRFEFENIVGGPGTSRSPWRSNASSASSLRMFEGDSIHLDLCLAETTAIKPSVVIYSNDGLPDTIGINIDKMYEFGPVDTGETLGGWGNDWNEFTTHNISQPSVGLGAGTHNLVFEVLSADCYGTELDAVDVMTNIQVDLNAFVCGSKLIRSTNPSSCAQDVDSAMTSSTTTKATSTPTGTTDTSKQHMMSTKSMSTEQSTQAMTSQSTASPITSAMMTMSTESTPKSTTSLTTTTTTSSPTSPSISSMTNTSSAQPVVEGPATEQNVSSVSTMSPTTPTTKSSTEFVSASSTNTTSATMSTSSLEKVTTVTISSTLSSTTPSSTTTSTLTTATTQSSTSSPTNNNFVKQMSYSSNCITSTNVRLQFKPTSLKGIQITVRNNPKRQTTFRRRINTDDDPKICKNQIWQIGKFNNDYTELGPLRYKNIDHDINAAADSQMPFPGLLNPQFTRSVTIRYVVPKNVNIGKGFVYLSIGLVDVTSDVSVGMQYHIRRKRNPSKVEYVTITPDNNVVGWDLPARAVSPSLENIITLYFNKSSTTPLKIDFIRLESLGMRPKLKKEKIVRTKQWRVRAFSYKPQKKKPTPDGMRVTVDGGSPFNNTERVMIFKKPFKKALTIFKNGRIFPVNQLKKRDDDEGSKFIDISGFVFGRPELEIKSVDFDTAKGILTITYTDDSYVKCVVTYNKFRTKLVVIESTIPYPNVEFISTYITNYVTAVNEVLVDNTKEVDVKDKSIEDTKSRRYAFIKTTPNKMYKVNDEYEIFFPLNILPK